MVGSESTSKDVQTSLSVFAGVSNSDDLGSTDGLRNGGPPYVDVSTRLVRYCQQLADVYLAFWGLTQQPISHESFLGFRAALFQYLGPREDTPLQLQEIFDAYADPIFKTRVVHAATRWAIAHEMAHAVATRPVRKRYEALIRPLWPTLDEEWRGASAAARTSYQDEIACDLLAVDFVLDSPFGRDDVMTQAGGSLLVLMATIWDGWLTDASATSMSHPSPTLRFHIVSQYWLTKFADRSTWESAQAPGPLAVLDHAMWTVFERWSAGEYGLARSGDVWRDDYFAKLDELVEAIPSVTADTIYAMHSDGGISRVQNR
ncbi:hypothetical protein [Nocardioides ganghwensis]|uniref:Uncharacterized protein n=1 Tax=Nocardioides ganghwensis TaxID=252230 RepID=A0A4Q2S690_9ACTN|nr:hypothetical protein [Nocardioides ganghwensis]MBD3946973.1 hypothetical protein [Nocardioides ganghwensis]RYB96890.1 hypothetical protein EUA07_21020 [Nocardioides ganghwensis]